MKFLGFTMEWMNLKDRFSSLPVSAQRLVGIGVVLALVVALPLFIWAIVTQKFLITKHAASGEPVCTRNYSVFTANLVHEDLAPTHRLDYELAIANNDSADCPASSFALVASVPTGWTSEFVTPSFNLNPGGSYGDNHLYITIPDNFNNFPQQISITLNSDVDQHNNVILLQFPSLNATPTPPGQLPDLIIQNITIQRVSPPEFTCESYKYSVTVKNVGTGSAAKTRVQTVIDPAQIQRTEDGCSSSRTYTGTNAPIPNHDSDLFLQPGASETISDYFNPDHDGHVTITAIADYSNQVQESNESNNSSTSGFDVLAVPFNTPPPGGRPPLLFKIKFEGVTDGSAEGAKASIRFVSGYINEVTPPVTFRYAGNGVYQAQISTTGFFLPVWGAGNGYTIYVKGEKHIANKFCTMTGQNGQCFGDGNIPVPETTAEPVSLYDFTGFPLQPGDLPLQNGNANLDDFNKVKNLLSKPCSSLSNEDKATADLDYNGCVNIRDAFLMRHTLEARYDEY